MGFWKEAWDAGVVAFPHGARVIEIGCAEADWIGPMKAVRPDLSITGIDWRKCERPAAATVIQGDVMSAGTSFLCDAVVSVSTIEHIGLGSYGEPIVPEGDTQTMHRAYDWLKRGGWMYLDVPYRPRGYLETGNYRGYDDAALESRLIVGGFTERWRKVFTQGSDAPYIALVLEKSV